MVKFWISPRVGRGDFFFSVVGLNISYVALQFWLAGGLELMLEVGFRTRVTSLSVLPIELTLLRLGFDAVLLWCVVRRLRDVGVPGWTALLALGLPLLLGSLGALATMVGLVALFFIPGTIGPNRFGPDPRGWQSREHFDEQQRHLRSGEV